MTNFEWGSKINILPYGMLYLVSALFLGTAVIFQPVIAVAAVLLILLLVASLSRPELISYFVLLTTAVSINFLFSGSMFGIEILSLYKLVILMLLVPCILVNGLKFRLSPPLWAMLALILLTFSFSIWLPEMSASIAVKAFIGLSLPFVLLLINWKKEVAEKQIRIITLLPLVSMLLGVVLQAANLHSLVAVEFTGAVRVQGANIPPHLAMLAFMGVAIAFIEIKRSPQYIRFNYIMLGLNFFILVITGTRGPILALVLMVLYYFYDISRAFLKGKKKFLIPLLCSLLVITSAVYMQLDNIKKRSFERTTETGIDLSGRAEAWEYFLNKAADSPYAGRGLGAVTVANDGTLYGGFVVPHNEYIRFYYDGGYIGAILLLLSLLAVFILVYRVLLPAVKPYYLLFIAAFLIYSFTDNTLSTVQFIIPFCWYLNCLYRSSQLADSPQKEVIR
ncbi:O-antigen ligase family protein [Paenibacillus tritici]|uniref:O-antigen ligase family protein n=1 Tax=Paenibacillus tritici TaxID=1873425 RepID=A0ABX2DTF8_9BACL|nr:O-antigen ligase family protein [Paenibacillus tritici]NQX47447.1 O-antigen ligase family protein [Paenibacillus tritici]QUL55879.1 O-antigen ligase family protein [Paenibacillus tritici]